MAELDGNNNVVSRFVYATGLNVPDYVQKGYRTYRIITDHLGGPRLVIDTETGEVVQRIDYDAFGTVSRDTKPGFQPFGFAGGLYDRASGLVRFGAGLRPRDRPVDFERSDPLRWRGHESLWLCAQRPRELR